MCEKVGRGEILSCFSNLSRVDLYSVAQPAGVSRPTHTISIGGGFQSGGLPIKDGDPSLLEFKVQKTKESNYFASLRELASQVQVGHS